MNWSVRVLRRAAAVTVASTLAVVGGGAPAFAASSGDADVVVVSEGMTIEYFDHEVATANGFEIRIDEFGREYSVPVTDEAKSAIGEMGTLGTVKGPCGTSTLLMSRNGAEVVRIGTAFRVYAPTVWHIWSVSLVNSFGSWTEPFDGGPTTGVWDATHEKNIRSSHGVLGQVTPGSYATLITGAVCYSGGPTAST